MSSARPGILAGSTSIATSRVSIACSSIASACRSSWLDFRPDYETIPGHARRPRAADRSPWLAWIKAPRSVEAPQATPYRPLARRQLAHRAAGGRRLRCRVANACQPVFRPPAAGLPVPDRAAASRPLVPGPQASRVTSARTGFKDQGLADLDERGWEEFLWRGEPFGFHVRSQPKLKGKESLETPPRRGRAEMLRRLQAPA